MKYRITSFFLKTASIFLMIFSVIIKTNAQNNSIAIIVKPKYDAVRFFTENRSAVSIGQKKQMGLAMTTINKWGFVDKNGVEVVPCKYDEVNDFHEGMAKVSLNGKFGYIDKSGKVIIPLKYDEISILATQNDFHEGLAAVCVNRKFGFIDKSGKVIIPIKYDLLHDFHEGIAIGGLRYNNQSSEVKFILIEKTGREIRLKNQYYSISDFKNGMAEVWWEGSQKWGCIDKTGLEVIPVVNNSYPHKDGAEQKFYDGFAQLNLGGDNNWIFINTKGAAINDQKYEDTWDFHQGFAAVKLKGKWGFIDKKGKLVVSTTFDDIRDFNQGFAAVELNGKWGFVDITGIEVVPCKYDEVHCFREGMIAVRLNGKWGFIDKSGKEIIPLTYENVNDFYEGYAAVKLDGFWSLLNNKGVIIFSKLADQDITYYFKDRGSRGNALEFKDGFIMIESNGKYGFAGIKVK